MLKSFIKILNLGIALQFVLVTLYPQLASALSLNLGASFSQPIVETRTNDKNNTLLAESATQSAIWPSISLESKERYIGNSHWGYSFSMMAWYYSVDKQMESGKLVDYGTSIDGYYAYFTPTLYYRFGDKNLMESHDRWNWTIGVGIGVGYLVANGDVYTNYAASKTVEKIQVDHGAASTGLFVEASKGRWYVRYSSYGPQGTSNNGKYTIRLDDNTLTIGRRFDIKGLF